MLLVVVSVMVCAIRIVIVVFIVMVGILCINRELKGMALPGFCQELEGMGLPGFLLRGVLMGFAIPGVISCGWVWGI